ncbi:LOW QUALITY PROTEIN: dentin matrix acidic phosphoprotein 1 [Chlamydotis macqueenii]
MGSSAASGTGPGTGRISKKRAYLVMTDSALTMEQAFRSQGSSLKAGLLQLTVAQHLRRKKLIVEKAPQAFENWLLSFGGREENTSHGICGRGWVENKRENLCRRCMRESERCDGAHLEGEGLQGEQWGQGGTEASLHGKQPCPLLAAWFCAPAPRHRGRLSPRRSHVGFGTLDHSRGQTPLPNAHVKRTPSLGWGPVLRVGDAVVVCVCHSGKCVKGINLTVKTQGWCSRSLTASPSRHPATTRSFFRAGVLTEAGGSVGGQFPVTPPRAGALPAGAIGCPSPGAGTGQRLNARTATGAHSLRHPTAGRQLAPSQALEETLACTTPRAAGTRTNMRAAFLVLLLWAVACAHPVPSHEPARPRRSAQQEDTANEDDINALGDLLDGGDGRHPPASAERGDNALAGDLAGGNAVGQDLGKLGSQDKGGRAWEAQHQNHVDHEDMNVQDGNGLGFLEEDARDADDGDNGEHHSTGDNGLPSYAGGHLDEEDDSGDDTFDENREEEGSEGPTYVAGADGAGEDGRDSGRDSGHGDAGAGRGHGDSSSSSSSESIGADHRRYRNYLGSWYQRTYRRGGRSSSSEEEEGYDFEDEAMQGDDPSVFDDPGSSYKGRRAGLRALGSSRESGRGAGSHRWEEGDSRSPEVRDTNSEEDSPSTEDNSQSEEPVTSQSEENSASRSGEDEDGEDSRSTESESSNSDQSDDEPGESPEDISQEVVGTSSERSGSQSQEGQEDRESAEDRSAPSMPDSESGEDEGDQSKSGEDDGDQSQSTEDTMEESKEDENDSDPDGDVPSTSAESQSASPEDDGSQEDDAGEDSRSMESNNSESQEDDDDDDESRSQEDSTRESSSRGDNSSPQSLESRSHKRRPGAYRHKPAADYDDNDCQDGY